MNSTTGTRGLITVQARLHDRHYDQIGAIVDGWTTSYVRNPETLSKRLADAHRYERERSTGSFVVIDLGRSLTDEESRVVRTFLNENLASTAVVVEYPVKPNTAPRTNLRALYLPHGLLGHTTTIQRITEGKKVRHIECDLATDLERAEDEGADFVVFDHPGDKISGLYYDLLHDFADNNPDATVLYTIRDLADAPDGWIVEHLDGYDPNAKPKQDYDRATGPTWVGTVTPGNNDRRNLFTISLVRREDSECGHPAAWHTTPDGMSEVREFYGETQMHAWAKRKRDLFTASLGVTGWTFVDEGEPLLPAQV